MTQFNYKKWVTENKYGKLNEQEETVTYYACSPCPEGAVYDNVYENEPLYMQPVPAGTYQCGPIVEYNIPSNEIQNNDDWGSDSNRLEWNEYTGNEIPQGAFTDWNSNNLN